MGEAEAGFGNAGWQVAGNDTVGRDLRVPWPVELNDGMQASKGNPRAGFSPGLAIGTVPLAEFDGRLAIIFLSSGTTE